MKYKVIRTDKGDGVVEELSVEYAQEVLEPAWYEVGTMDECMIDGKPFTLESSFMTYDFVLN